MTERSGMHHEVRATQAIFRGFKIIWDWLPIRCEMLRSRKEDGWGAGQEGDTYQNLSFSSAKQGSVTGSKCQLIPST